VPPPIRWIALPQIAAASSFVTASLAITSVLRSKVPMTAGAGTQPTFRAVQQRVGNVLRLTSSCHLH